MSHRINLFDLRDPKVFTLHLSWFAFFLTFVIWFNHAPLLASIQQSLRLSDQQIKALMVLNVALTIPARIVVGMLVDRFGPRRAYTTLLVLAGCMCFGVASAASFGELALFRFLLGFAGAGFVIGIRLVGEWFPAKQVGVAEGIYGGWGNFGSAAAAMTLPTIALLFSADYGWRYAMASTGVIAILYACLFYWKVRDTPKGSTYFKPKRNGGLEVTSRRDFAFLILMNLPMYGALGLLAWKLGPSGLGLLGAATMAPIGVGLVSLFLVQTWQLYRVNREVFRTEVPRMQRYEFKQVAILEVAYLVSFGAELAVVSMLPLFFLQTFTSLGQVEAALMASSFAFMNLAARPGGGWLSDKFGRRKTLMILITGMGVGFSVLSTVDAGWSIALAVVATMSCSFFVQAAEGAVFAMVPLVQRRMTGQIAGMVGAFGNVGGVLFLTVLAMVSASTFFLVIAGAAGIGLLCCMFLDEPRGHMAEVHEDGTVELLEVA